MATGIVIAGFGGQGVLFAGQVLAYAAMESGHQVTWIPSYGPEMRGGTANCTVIIAEQEIGSPLVRNPQAALVMNLPSLEKYEPQVRPGGVLVSNASLINRRPARSDVQVTHLPANEIAESLGDRRLTNMVMVGALLASLPVLSLDAVMQALEGHLPERHRRLLPSNRRALEAGHEFVPKHRVEAA